MTEQPDREQQTEAPTAKRRRDAEAKGDVLQSRELATALVVAGGAAWMLLAGGWFVASLRHGLRLGLALDRRDVLLFDPAARSASVLLAVWLPVTTLFATTLFAAFAGPALLGALGFRPAAFAPKPSRMSPGAGLARMFGRSGWVELGKAWVKVMVIAAAGGWSLYANFDRLRGLAMLDPQHLGATLGHLFVELALVLAAALLLIGLVDAPVQLLRRLARLRMSRHEVKEELKESDGNPENKQQQRSRRHELLNGSARKAVTEANVVLTNPTHFAVALRYRPGKDAAPQVVARGRGETALAIKALAREHAVPQLEYPQLTRAIYYTARAGQPVAHDLYLAVATVLAFVFNLDRCRAEGWQQPDVDVPESKRFDAQGRRAT